MSDLDQARLRETTASVRHLAEIGQAIGAAAQSMHLLLLDSGLAAPRVPRSWDVEREDFLRQLDS
jgi:hypothetical protein